MAIIEECCARNWNFGVGTGIYNNQSTSMAWMVEGTQRTRSQKKGHEVAKVTVQKGLPCCLNHQKL